MNKGLFLTHILCCYGLAGSPDPQIYSGILDDGAGLWQSLVTVPKGNGALEDRGLEVTHATSHNSNT